MSSEGWEAPKEQVRVPCDDDPSHNLSLDQAADMLRIFKRDHPFIFVRVYGKSLGVDLTEEQPARKPRGSSR